GCFFVQAEGGIRDWSVTGVQTCALPISGLDAVGERHVGDDGVLREAGRDLVLVAHEVVEAGAVVLHADAGAALTGVGGARVAVEIGRASCRERVWSSVVGGWLKRRENCE